MNKKQRIEFIPLAIFLISGTFMFFKLPHLPWLVALSGVWLGSIYFYASFWLLSDYKIAPINRIIAGLCFSEPIITCMFCFLNWPGWPYFSVISFALLGIVLVICLFNYRNTDYKQLLYRGLSFVFMLLLVCGYKWFLA